MRRVVDSIASRRPFGTILFRLWRKLPLPRGWRSRIIQRVNDQFLVGVMVLVWDEEGRLLLVRNTYAPRFPWTLPGGWMHRDEQPADCARRELREETGYEIELDGLVGVLTQRKLPSVDVLYQGRILAGEFQPSAEISRAEFFPLDAFPEGFSPIHRQLLARFLDDQEGFDARLSSDATRS